MKSASGDEGQRQKEAGDARDKCLGEQLQNPACRLARSALPMACIEMISGNKGRNRERESKPSPKAECRKQFRECAPLTEPPTRQWERVRSVMHDALCGARSNIALFAALAQRFQQSQH